MKRFKPSDLKQYMKVIHRNGNGKLYQGEGSVNFDENMNYKYGSKIFDIMEVYEPTLDGWNLLWKREEPQFYLVFPEAMYHCERILCYSTQDDVYFDKPIDFKYRVKKSFTQEEIDEIPFNTDMFEKREV